MIIRQASYRYTPPMQPLRYLQRWTDRQSMYPQTFLGLSVSCSMSYHPRLELAIRSIEALKRITNYFIGTRPRSADSALVTGSLLTLKNRRNSWVPSKVAVTLFPKKKNTWGGRTPYFNPAPFTRKTFRHSRENDSFPYARRSGCLQHI
jgi:hypothetical protein